MTIITCSKILKNCIQPDMSANVTARMNQMALRPFRKIRVKDHLLGPLLKGQKPSVLHCLQASRIVADELTVRLGRRCLEIEKLPNGVGQLPYARQVVEWYTQTCKELFDYTDELEYLRKELPEERSKGSLFGDFFGFLEAPSKRGGYSSLFPSFQTMEPHQIPKVQNLRPEMLSPKSEDLENIVFGTECRDPVLIQQASKHVNKLFDILERAVQRHKPIVLLTAKEISKLEKTMFIDPVEVQNFLTKFHHQRIAVRLLIGHSVALSRPLPLDNMIGIFCTKTPIEEIVQESVALAEEMSLLTYGCVPPVELSCTPSSSSIDLLYIPSHLQHIIFELVKNSMRAVIEKEQERIGTDGIVNTASLPPIMIHWDINEKECIFQVRDLGKGILKKDMSKVFLFHYTTAKPPEDNGHVMAGYGYGLPLSRIYARFLKGDIWLESKEGEGTVVYVKCKTKWDPDELI